MEHKELAAMPHNPLQMAQPPVLKEGYLLKKSPVKHKGFQQRWFQLTPLYLRYYRLTGSRSKVCEKKGELPVSFIRYVRQMVTVDGQRKDLLDDRIAIDVGSEQRQFLLKASSVEEATEWVELLQLAMEGYKLLANDFIQEDLDENAKPTSSKKKWWKAKASKHRSNGNVPEMRVAEQWKYWDYVKSQLVPSLPHVHLEEEEAVNDRSDVDPSMRTSSVPDPATEAVESDTESEQEVNSDVTDQPADVEPEALAQAGTKTELEAEAEAEATKPEAQDGLEPEAEFMASTSASVAPVSVAPAPAAPAPATSSCEGAVLELLSGRAALAQQLAQERKRVEEQRHTHARALEDALALGEARAAHELRDLRARHEQAEGAQGAAMAAMAGQLRTERQRTQRLQAAMAAMAVGRTAAVAATAAAAEAQAQAAAAATTATAHRSPRQPQHQHLEPQHTQPLSSRALLPSSAQGRAGTANMAVTLAAGGIGMGMGGRVYSWGDKWRAVVGGSSHGGGGGEERSLGLYATRAQAEAALATRARAYKLLKSARAGAGAGAGDGGHQNSSKYSSGLGGRLSVGTGSPSPNHDTFFGYNTGLGFKAGGGVASGGLSSRYVSAYSRAYSDAYRSYSSAYGNSNSSISSMNSMDSNYNATAPSYDYYGCVTPSVTQIHQQTQP